MDIYKILLTKQHVDKSPHGEIERRNWFGDLRLQRVKVLELPADTVSHLAERLRDKHRVWVRILRVSIYLFDPLRLFSYVTLAKRWKVQFRQVFA